MRIDGNTTLSEIMQSENSCVESTENELTHWGIKGQKWGIRRFQNKDGSLTSAGKKRKNASDEAPDSREVRQLAALSANKNSSVTTRDRAAFSWDSEGTDELHWNEKLSSKNPDHVKKISKELDDYWKKSIKEDNDEFGDNDGHAQHYYDTYVKNNKEAYAKAVLEDVEYWRNEREKAQHSDTYSDELAHHGIKGQKWGIRRFQNKDGSLTKAGERRRAKLENESDKGGSSAGGSKGGGSSASGKKSISEMTDDELVKEINRARLENAYKQLHPDPPPVEKHPLMKKFINEAVVPAAVNSGKKILENAMMKASEKLLGDKVDPDSLEALTKVRDKLKITNEINKLRNNPEGDTNWDNMLKRQQYEANKKKAEKEEADEKAKQDKADADETARSANEFKSQEYYNSTYSNKGGESTTVNPNAVTSLAIYNKSVSSISNSTVNSGKSTVNDHMDDGYYELIDRNGNVIPGVSFRSDD